MDRPCAKARLGLPLRLRGQGLDGIEALAALRGDDRRAPLPRPFVVLLDLNMPRMNGLGFPAELRRDPALGEVARLLGRYCELNEFPPN